MVMLMHCPDCLVAGVANMSQRQGYPLLLLLVESVSQMSILRRSYARLNSMTPSDPIIGLILYAKQENEILVMKQPRASQATIDAFCNCGIS